VLFKGGGRGKGNADETYVFQAAALVVLQQAVLPAEVAVAKGAVADDALSRLSALLGVAAKLLGHDGRELRRRRRS
jgi:hypothetical protein